MTNKRKSWDQHWMEKAIHDSEMSTCASGRRVGAIIVTPDNTFKSSGFNGVPRKFPHPEECERRKQGVPSGEKLDLCPCSHAESNAIDNAAREGHSTNGCILYCTTRPCVPCMGRLVNAGIRKVVYMEDYPQELSAKIAFYGGVELVRYEVHP